MLATEQSDDVLHFVVRFAIIIALMLRASIATLAFALIAGCGLPDSGQVQTATPAQPVLYPAGEYITTLKATPAADTAVELTLAIKALERNDRSSIRILRSEGSLFNLSKGTVVALLPAKDDSGKFQSSAVVGTIDGLHICIAAVESGDRIGNEVALGCDGLSRSNQ
ncbi:MAG: hypothetical protein ACYDCM_06355 [Candidatus Acidiferrales bacterium]